MLKWYIEKHITLQQFFLRKMLGTWFGSVGT